MTKHQATNLKTDSLKSEWWFWWFDWYKR